MQPPERAVADRRHALGYFQTCDIGGNVIPRLLDLVGFFVAEIVHRAFTRNRERIVRLVPRAGCILIFRIFHPLAGLFIIPAGILVFRKRPGQSLAAGTGHIIVFKPLTEPRRIVKGLPHTVNGTPPFDIFFACQTDLFRIDVKVYRIQKRVIPKGAAADIRHVLGDRDLMQAVHRDPAVAEVPAEAAVFKRMLVDRFQTRGQDHAAQSAEPAERARADRRHALAHVHAGDRIGQIFPWLRNKAVLFVIIIVHRAFALDNERIKRFIMRAGIGMIRIGRSIHPVAGFIILPEAVLIFRKLPGNAFAACAAHRVFQEPHVIPRRVVKDLLHAPGVAPVGDFLFARQTDIFRRQFAFKKHVVQKIVVRKRLTGDIRHVCRDRNVKKAADRAPVVAVAHAAHAVFKCERTDAFQRVGQENASQIIATAERVVADMRHALAHVHAGDVPAHFLPRLGETVVLLIPVIVHLPVAVDGKRIKRFIADARRFRILRLLHPFAGLLIIPAGVVVFRQLPGKAFAAGPVQIVRFKPFMEKIRIVKDLAYAIRRSPVLGVFLPCQTDVLNTAEEHRARKEFIVCERSWADIC